MMKTEKTFLEKMLEKYNLKGMNWLKAIKSEEFYKIISKELDNDFGSREVFVDYGEDYNSKNDDRFFIAISKRYDCTYIDRYKINNQSDLDYLIKVLAEAY